MKATIEQLIKSSNVRHAWIGLTTTANEIAKAQTELESLKSQISSFDRVNVFSDSPEEAREKDCKQRVELRRADLERYKKAVGSFLRTAAQDEPDFARAVELESFLRRATEAGSPEALKALEKEVQSWLSDFQAAEPGSLERPSADSALDVLVTGEYQNTRQALRCLIAPFSLVKIKQENRWGENHPTLALRALILKLVENCHQAFILDCPDIPLPCDIYRGLVYQEEESALSSARTALKNKIQKSMDEAFANMLRHCRNLAGLKLLIERNKKQISTVDRVVFWSDTEAEAREKEWKAQLAQEEEVLTRQWDTLCAETCILRPDVWQALVLDLGHNIHALVNKIEPTKLSGIINKTCQVACREEPVMAVDEFRRAVLERYPYKPDVDALKQQVEGVEAQAPAIDQNLGDAPPAFDQPEVLAALAHELQTGGYHSHQQQATEAREEIGLALKEHKQALQEKGFFGALGHVAKAVGSGDLANTMKAGWQAKQMNAEATVLFYQALARAHSPSAFSALLERLSSELSEITAYVAERRSTGSDGTEQYGALKGKDEALLTSGLLREVLLSVASDVTFPLQSLDEFSENMTTRSLAQQPYGY